MTINVRYLSKDQIEGNAEWLLTDYEATAGASLKAPIPVDEIAKYHLALRLEFANLHQTFGRPMTGDEPDILGALFLEAEAILIDCSLDPKTNPLMIGRCRFSIAHEIGHWRLHRHIFAKNSAKGHSGSFAPPLTCPSRTGKDRIEWQADFYASCLLMPRELIFDSWRERFGTNAPFIFENDQFNPTFAPKQANQIRNRRLSSGCQAARRRDCRAIFNNIARELTESFCVSAEAMCIRLQNLDLLRVREPRELWSTGGL
jgi:hypothetical protein